MKKVELSKKVIAAIKAGDCETVKLLVSTSGLLNPETPYGTWLHYAARRGQMEVIRCLVALGADVNKRGGTFNSGPVQEAVSQGENDIVQFLVSSGAVFDVSDSERNPLFTAIVIGRLDTVKLLVSLGIDYSVKYNGPRMKNMDASAFARERGQLEIAMYLESLA